MSGLSRATPETKQPPAASSALHLSPIDGDGERFVRLKLVRFLLFLFSIADVASGWWAEWLSRHAARCDPAAVHRPVALSVSRLLHELRTADACLGSDLLALSSACKSLSRDMSAEWQRISVLRYGRLATRAADGEEKRQGGVVTSGDWKRLLCTQDAATLSALRFANAAWLRQRSPGVLCRSGHVRFLGQWRALHVSSGKTEYVMSMRIALKPANSPTEPLDAGCMELVSLRKPLCLVLCVVFLLNRAMNVLHRTARLAGHTSSRCTRATATTSASLVRSHPDLRMLDLLCWLPRCRPLHRAVITHVSLTGAWPCVPRRCFCSALQARSLCAACTIVAPAKSSSLATRSAIQSC